LGTVHSYIRPEVPVPSQFSIPYKDLELTTPDNVKIKTFLLLQQPVLDINETPVEWDEKSGEEVRHCVTSRGIHGS
jgi:hypothetical protein